MSISTLPTVTTMSQADFVGVSIGWADWKLPLSSLAAAEVTTLVTKTEAYTVAQTDNNSTLLYDSATGSALTLPTGLKPGTVVTIVQIGTGSWALTPARGMSTVGVANGTSTARYAPAHAMLLNATTWLLVGTK